MKFFKKLVTVICAIILVLGLIFGMGHFLEGIYNLWLGRNEVYIISGNLSLLVFVFIIGFVFVFLWLFAPEGIQDPFWDPEEDMETGESGKTEKLAKGEAGNSEGMENLEKREKVKGIKAHFSMGKKIRTAFLALVIMILGGLVSMLWFERFGTEGVERFTFGITKSYTWEDAESFTLKADFHNMLIFRISMKDGTKHYFNGGFLRVIEYNSDGFDEKFSDSEAYMVWLAKKLKEYEVPLELENKEKLLKELETEGDYWRKAAEEIIESYEQ